MRCLLAIALSVPLFGQATRVDDAALKNSAKLTSDGDWLSYGLTPGETRYSPLKQIDRSNVKRLGLVWSYEVGDGGGDQEATPLVWNNTIFGVTNWSIVFAVDARTGKEKWRWDPLVNRKATSDKMCCGVVNRGLALYHNKVYVPVNDGRLEALEADTGKPVWEARVCWVQHEQTLTMAPRIAKGKVIVGAAGGDRPTRGFFAAYDAETGREVWRFYTVPGDPAKGFESSAMRKAAATWEGEWWKLGGGGAVWDGISYDPDSELLYVGTGNAEPWPQALRTKDVSTGRDNLYVASIVAVHVDTGELKWHYQMVPGDEWDYDSVQQMILADLNINGRTRKVIMQANKNGFFYVLDRITG
ncbi:MAG: PQQ-binding-like beta-propeller repeat protein, partial [Acidobacteria bacterium Pan2503]|nr:PQQ-binding-like beta-propeller repeat protein [Candidatus Acidoferrum panamensis]